MTIHSTFKGQQSVPSALTIYASAVGAAAADMTSPKGAVSIKRTGTGLYTILLPRAYKGGLLGISMSVLTSATAANFALAVLTSTVETDGKITIALLSSASNSANAPIIADALTTDTYLFTIHVQDTAQKPAGRV